jgi:WD40 repeat protein
MYTMDRPRALKIADDSTLIRQFEEQSGKIFALAFSPDGSKIAVGGIAREVPIYDTESGERIAACTGHDGGIFVVAFHPDGSRVATGGFDGKVRLYDIQTGEQVDSFVPVPLERVAGASAAQGAG